MSYSMLGVLCFACIITSAPGLRDIEVEASEDVAESTSHTLKKSAVDNVTNTLRIDELPFPQPLPRVSRRGEETLIAFVVTYPLGTLPILGPFKLPGFDLIHSELVFCVPQPGTRDHLHTNWAELQNNQELMTRLRMKRKCRSFYYAGNIYSSFPWQNKAYSNPKLYYAGLVDAFDATRHMKQMASADTGEYNIFTNNCHHVVDRLMHRLALPTWASPGEKGLASWMMPENKVSTTWYVRLTPEERRKYFTTAGEVRHQFTASNGDVILEGAQIVSHAPDGTAEKYMIRHMSNGWKTTLGALFSGGGSAGGSFGGSVGGSVGGSAGSAVGSAAGSAAGVYAEGLPDPGADNQGGAIGNHG